MAGPKGNLNRSKDKLVEAALRRELTQNPEDALLIARACIDKAKEGDIPAMAFIRDTVDGKPTEHVQIDETLTVHVGDQSTVAPALTRALELRTKPTVQ